MAGPELVVGHRDVWGRHRCPHSFMKSDATDSWRKKKKASTQLSFTVYLLQFDASKLSMDSIYWTRSTEWQ